MGTLIQVLFSAWCYAETLTAEAPVLAEAPAAAPKTSGEGNCKAWLHSDSGFD
jgi:hypothetical protein